MSCIVFTSTDFLFVLIPLFHFRSFLQRSCDSQLFIFKIKALNNNSKLHRWKLLTLCMVNKQPPNFSFTNPNIHVGRSFLWLCAEGFSFSTLAPPNSVADRCSHYSVYRHLPNSAVFSLPFHPSPTLCLIYLSLKALRFNF